MPDTEDCLVHRTHLVVARGSRLQDVLEEHLQGVRRYDAAGSTGSIRQTKLLPALYHMKHTSMRACRQSWKPYFRHAKGHPKKC